MIAMMTHNFWTAKFSKRLGVFVFMLVQSTFVQITFAQSAPIQNYQGHLAYLEHFDDKTDDAMLDNPALTDQAPPKQVPLGVVSPVAVREFVQAVDIVRKDYADSIDDDKLFNYAIAGMVKQLDGHAEFLDENALQNLREFTEGHVAHVGIVANFNPANKTWVIDEITQGSSAQKAGIQVGDYLHQIGDIKLTDSATQNDVNQLLLGIAGTFVDVSVSSQGRHKKTYHLQRTDTKDTQISVQMHDGVALVQLPVFTSSTRQELMERLVLIPEPVHAVILDVRNNPGGVLSSAIDIASLFMPSMPVISVVKKDVVTQTMSTNGTALFDEMPVFVLQNRYSASAAEVLAESLSKDAQSTIVGETSYGKGSIQSVIPLDNKAIKLTSAYYETTDGKRIDGVGVSPQIALNFDDENWFSQLSALINDKKLKVGMRLVSSNDY